MSYTATKSDANKVVREAKLKTNLGKEIQAVYAYINTYKDRVCYEIVLKGETSKLDKILCDVTVPTLNYCINRESDLKGAVNLVLEKVKNSLTEGNY